MKQPLNTTINRLKSEKNEYYVLYADTFGYNARSEVIFSRRGAEGAEAYSYDDIGNLMLSAFNAETNTYTANNLNQYTSILRASATPYEPTYDTDGNLTQDDKYSYAYDAENRLVSVAPITPVNGDLSVLNTYDHRHRRILKRVKCYDNGEWVLSRTHSFAYDGNNIVLERMTLANGESHIVENFWGNDLSGSEEGAGGVGGLLAVSVDGAYCFPCCDNNGNITRYISEDGLVVAQFTYDPYGNVLEQAGAAADFLRFRFSTKYTDSEVGIVSYLMRFYKPSNGRWLNRDPIEEYGGENLYAFCQNNPTSYYDVNGCWAFIDNVVAFVTGAVIGAGLQAVSDIVRGEVSGWETYVGAAVAGGVVAEVLLHVPTAVGMSKAIYGGAAAAAGNLVKQTCEVFVSKKSDNYDWKNFSVDTVAGASLAMIPFPKIPHITTGRGSYLAVARRINTQYANGTISHVSAMTTIKSTVGVATEYGVAYNVTQPMLLDVEQKVESALTIFYYETISIRIVDKCGNVVDVTYQGEFKTNEQ